MKRLDYIALLTQKFDSSLSEKGQSELNSWANESVSNQNDIDFVERIWQESTNVEPDVKFNAASAFEKFKINNDLGTGSIPVATSSAGLGLLAKLLLGLFLAAGAYLGYTFLTNNNSLSNNSNTIENIALDNGTEVWLDQQSALTSDVTSDGESTFTVNGRAYVDVSDDENINFKLNGSSITANESSSFSLTDKNNGSTMLDVESGTVVLNSNNSGLSAKNSKGSSEINSANNSDGSNNSNSSGSLESTDDASQYDTSSGSDNQSGTVIVSAGERVIIDEAGNIHKTQLLTNNAFSWKAKTLEFNNTPLSIVISDLEEYYGIDIQTSIPNLETCSFTSPKLTNTKMEVVFDILKESHQADFQKSANNNAVYYLNKVNCQ